MTGLVFANSDVSIVTALASIVTACVLGFVVLRIGRPAVKQMMDENEEARENRRKMRLQILDLQRYQETLLHTFRTNEISLPHPVEKAITPETAADLQRYQDALTKALNNAYAEKDTALTTKPETGDR